MLFLFFCTLIKGQVKPIFYFHTAAEIFCKGTCAENFSGSIATLFLLLTDDCIISLNLSIIFSWHNNFLTNICIFFRWCCWLIWIVHVLGSIIISIGTCLTANILLAVLLILVRLHLLALLGWLLLWNASTLGDDIVYHVVWLLNWYFSMWIWAALIPLFIDWSLYSNIVLIIVIVS